MYNPAEIKGLYHTSLYLGLSSNLFKKLMQLQSGIYHMAQCQEPCAQMVRLYFWSTLMFWQEDVAKIFKVPGAPHNVNPARAITW